MVVINTEMTALFCTQFHTKTDQSLYVTILENFIHTRTITSSCAVNVGSDKEVGHK